MATFPDSSSGFAMSLRIDRPVEGCEIACHPFLFIRGGAMDNATRQKIMDANPHSFIYRWSRGPRRQICANTNCPRGSSLDPVHWSKFACGGPALICTVCERAKMPRHESFFCSVRYEHRALNFYLTIYTLPIPLYRINAFLGGRPTPFEGLRDPKKLFFVAPRRADFFETADHKSDHNFILY
jgi:hypothetical protein